MRKIVLFLQISALTACVSNMSEAPYQLKSNSQKHPDLTNRSIQASNGQLYSTEGYIEMFSPNYFVVVGAPDNRSLDGDFEGASLAATAAVRKFDCANGTEIKHKNRYSEVANQWLVVIDCHSGGRSVTGI